MAAIIGSETTPTIGAVFIAEHWVQQAQLADRKNQVLAATVDTQYEAEMQSGRVMHIAHVLNQAVTAKSDNTIVVPDAQTPTNQDITVSRYFYTATNWQSMTEVQANIVNINTIAGQMGYALLGQIETDLAALSVGLSRSRGTYGQELTMDDWENIWGDLQIGLANGQRFAWLSSAMISAWRKLGITIDADFSPSNFGALDSATQGSFLGMQMVESQYLQAPATGQHAGSAQSRDQFILVRQKEPTIERDRILGDISTLVVGWELFITAEREIIAEAAGAESLTDKHGVWIKSV